MRIEPEGTPFLNEASGKIDKKQELAEMRYVIDCDWRPPRDLNPCDHREKEWT
jgi:hypothetical protein